MSINESLSGQYGNSNFTVSTVPGQAKYNTITDAAAAAGSAGGGTIYIYPGTYTENISWPANCTIVGASGGQLVLVYIVGNQRFAAGGPVGFQNIYFRCPSVASAFEISPAGSVASLVAFTFCVFSNIGGGQALLSIPGNPATASVQLIDCQLTGDYAAFVVQGASIGIAKNCSFYSPSSSQVPIQILDSSTLTLSNCTVGTSGVGTAACINIRGQGSLYSTNNYYYAANDPACCAFSFWETGLVNPVTSLFDTFNVQVGTYFAGIPTGSPPGAYGPFSYASAVISTGATALIDPNITSSALRVIGVSPSSFTWNNNAITGPMLSNNGYIVTTGAVVLNLPTTSVLGDQLIVLLTGGTSWTIAQGASQYIVVGGFTSTVGTGGSVASNAAGETAILTCIAANLGWQMSSGVGTLTVV